MSPHIPRFAPPRAGHARTDSRSPTRPRLADDILADLSPATILEAFTNPSGKLKASIEAATPSERAFGLRATLMSKKIQEWVDELSGWPWPAEGGSLGFEMPTPKRRKLSTQAEEHNGNGTGCESSQEPAYMGSLLATEVERYQTRIDDIAAEMEDLDVEAIKRHVLDTHFSPRSRPSSSGSTAPPMPSLFSSYTRMDDFTVVITATVLRSLPNLSRLMRLMDAWKIRLVVLRNVPPLLSALDDAEIALQSGWAKIRTPGQTLAGNEQPLEDRYLSRTAFEVMRGTLQQRVTGLGRDIDYMLDTLEGRKDTLPEAWLDRMESLESDYGSWVVSGDRKVREGEWVKMAKARKDQEEARELREAETADLVMKTVELEAGEAARRKAEPDIRDAETAMLKAEWEAQANEEEEAMQRKVEDHAREVSGLEALRRADAVESSRLLTQEREHAAELDAEKKSIPERALMVAEQAEANRPLAEQQTQVEVPSFQAKKQARRVPHDSEGARVTAEKEAQEQAMEAVRVETEQRAVEVARQQILQTAPKAERVQHLAEQDAEEAAMRQANAAEQAKVRTEREFADAVNLKIKQDEEQAEAQRRRLSKISRKNGLLLAEALLVSKRKAEQETTTQRLAEPPAGIPNSGYIDEENPDHRDTEDAVTEVPQDVGVAPLVGTMERATSCSGDVEWPKQADIDCDVCVELQHSKPSPPLNPPAATKSSAASSRATRNRGFVESFVVPDLDDAIKPQISQYAPFDGANEDAEPASRKIKVDISGKDATMSPALASPNHLDDSSPQTPTSIVSTSAKVLTSPPSEASTSPPVVKAPGFGHPFASFIRRASPHEQNSLSLDLIEDRNLDTTTPISAPGNPAAKFAALTDGANDDFEFDNAAIRTSVDSEWLTIDSPSSADVPDRQIEIANSSSSAFAVSGYPSEDATPEIQEARPVEYFHASFNRTTDANAEDYDATTRLISSTADPTILNPSRIVFRTPTKTCPAFDPSFSWNESGNALLSPVHEERMLLSTEPPSYDGSCEPCEIAIRELTPNEDDHGIDMPIFARRTSITRIDSPIGQISTSPQETSVKVTFHGPSGAQYIISMPSDGSLTQTNNTLSVSFISCDTINLEEQCILNTIDCPPTLVAQTPGRWMLVPPQAITSIALASRSSFRKSSVVSLAGDTLRRESVSSNASTVIHGRVSESPRSPIVSPISEDVSQIFPDTEQSPSAGRVGKRSEKSYDISPPGSPPGKPQRPSLSILKQAPLTPSASIIASTPRTASSTGLEAPLFSNIDISTTPLATSPKKANSDEHMQQQISSLLETIPARIRLTSEPGGTPVVPQELCPKRSRASLTPSYRPSSSTSNYSTSSRAPTPSFTLTPAYGKTSSRPRPRNSNPEIKLYHLSRSPTEAPIKLFVRLVGEHGERVMVRVGGGWADLGEYLKEYASHHGRRSNVDVGDKIEIGDLTPRNVSSSSTASIRTGRASPALPRPQSVLDRERPGSPFGLQVRKTRRSFGSSSADPVTMTRMSNTRYPSTPLPIASSSSLAQSQRFQTPPSATSSVDTGRTSSLSWTDEDSSLGLAGPKSKKVVMSERDQEWVESMKEKVRLASAEKERRERAGLSRSGRKESFGELERVGGTKRLFRKSGM